jgi:hypothetical protein
MRNLRRQLAVFAAVLLLLPFFWFVRVKLQVREAKRFCESLLPHIHQIHTQKGSYPLKADPSWWAGRSVPSLIRTQDFYFSRDGSAFLLRFRDPSGFMDNIWGFDSRWMGWISYDGY